MGVPRVPDRDGLTALRLAKLIAVLVADVAAAAAARVVLHRARDDPRRFDARGLELLELPPPSNSRVQQAREHHREEEDGGEEEPERGHVTLRVCARSVYCCCSARS